ncbi:hypothetical protein KM043_000860 [Ampulex compressa]|nr:hypothetical protein KM043_000860 [Ampulex compressa]
MIVRSSPIPTPFEANVHLDLEKRALPCLRRSSDPCDFSATRHSVDSLETVSYGWAVARTVSRVLRLRFFCRSARVVIVVNVNPRIQRAGSGPGSGEARVGKEVAVRVPLPRRGTSGPAAADRWHSLRYGGRWCTASLRGFRRHTVGGASDVYRRYLTAEGTGGKRKERTNEKGMEGPGVEGPARRKRGKKAGNDVSVRAAAPARRARAKRTELNYQREEGVEGGSPQSGRVGASGRLGSPGRRVARESWPGCSVEVEAGGSSDEAEGNGWRPDGGGWRKSEEGFMNPRCAGLDPLCRISVFEEDGKRAARRLLRKYRRRRSSAAGGLGIK